MPIVLKSGSLNLLEPSGPLKACNGIALPFYLFVGPNMSFAMSPTNVMWRSPNLRSEQLSPLDNHCRCNRSFQLCRFAFLLRGFSNRLRLVYYFPEALWAPSLQAAHHVAFLFHFRTSIISLCEHMCVSCCSIHSVPQR